MRKQMQVKTMRAALRLLSLPFLHSASRPASPSWDSLAWSSTPTPADLHMARAGVDNEIDESRQEEDARRETNTEKSRRCYFRRFVVGARSVESSATGGDEFSRPFSTALRLASDLSLRAELKRVVANSRCEGVQPLRSIAAARARHNDCMLFFSRRSLAFALFLSLLVPFPSAVTIRVLALTRSTSSSSPLLLHNKTAGVQVGNACWELYCLEHG